MNYVSKSQDAKMLCQFSLILDSEFPVKLIAFCTHKNCCEIFSTDLS